VLLPKSPPQTNCGRDRNAILHPYRPTVMSTLRRAALVVSGTVMIAAEGLSGCAAANHKSGTISGTAQPCIGPYIPSAHYTVGYVSMSKGSRTVAKQTNLASPYKFSFTVSPDTFRVAAPGNGSVQARLEQGKTVTVALHSSCQ